jgi:hypothetical protein
VSGGAITVAFHAQIGGIALLIHADAKVRAFKGTCFPFRWRHIFLTAGHCVQNLQPTDLIIRSQGGRDFRVSEIHRNAEGDVAAVVGDPTDGGVPFPFAGLHQFEGTYGIGDEVATFGFPIHGTIQEPPNVPTPRVLRGYVQRIADFASGGSPTYRAYELSFPSLPGLSGAPLFVPGSDRVFGLITGNDVTEAALEGHSTPQIITFAMALSLWQVEQWLKEVAPLAGDARY